MANNFAPTVTTKQNFVEIGKQIALKSMYEVFDLDADSTVERIRFRDDGNLNYSGYFHINGVKQAANEWIEITAAQLSKVFYRAGLIVSSEALSVQVYDGLYWSNASNNVNYTVTPNDDAPVITTTPGNVLAQEKRSLTGLFDVTDPDGYPIEQYMFVDRSYNSNGGYFQVDGVRKPSAQWFTVDAASLDKVEYVSGSFGPQSENIGIMAFDGAQWAGPENVRVHTIRNAHAPQVTVFKTSSSTNRTMAFESMFEWSDADGNTAKRYGIYDSGPEVASGYFSINGVRQAAETWITFDASLLSKVQYHTSNLSSSEVVYIGVLDGAYWSQSAANLVTSVGRPAVDITANDLHVNTLEKIEIDTIFTQGGDPGPDFVQYQVFDENPSATSGLLLVDGVPLENGVWHTLSAAQFDSLEFEGAISDDGRSFDSLLVRGNNGLFWSETERVNFFTDPVGSDALTGTVWEGLDNGSKHVITYTFIDGFNNNSDPPRPPLMDYYSDDDPEANATRAMNNDQRAAIRESLAFMETFADIDFVEVPYHISGFNAAMTFGTANLPAGVGAWAYFPGGDGLASKPGDVWFNRQAGYDPLVPHPTGLGSSFRATAYHEIGHALGLKHPFEGDPTLPISVDFEYNTIMSYSSDFSFHPEQASTYMLWDIEHIQELYRPNEEYNTGNDHFFFTESHLQSVYDAGGIDTFNMTNHFAGESIDLREGFRSSLQGVANSVLIPYGVVIENARGGRGNDTIQGNEIRNLMWGNEGNDTLIGGGGNDLLRGGAGDDTYVWSIGDGRDSVREEGAGGIDIMEFHDSTGQLNSLEDDFIAYRFGSDLRIDLTLDRGQAMGSMVVAGFGNTGSAVETLRLYDSSDQQVGEDIDVNSIFVQAGARGTRFRVTDNIGPNGFLAVPV